MIPKKPIPPMYYLNEMAKVFEIEVKLLEIEFKNRIKRADTESQRKVFVKQLTEQEIIDIQLSGLDEQKASIEAMKRVLGRK